MNDTPDIVDNLSALFDQLDTFSPIIETPDLLPFELFPSQSSDSSVQSPILPVSPPLRFVAQNVNKSNIAMHTLLNSYLPWSSNTPSISPPNPCLTADIIMIQEPWWGRIGGDMQTDLDKLGSVNNNEWTIVLPSILNPYPDVVTYVRKSRTDLRFSPRPDLCDSPSVMVLEVQHANGSLFVVNIYNPIDSASLIPLLALPILGSQPCIISGDFNLHHPLWSLDSMDRKSSTTSDILVDTLSQHNFTLLNQKGLTTYFRKEYQSVLDLTWTSAHVPVSDWEVSYHRHTGSDHYPITWSVAIAPLPPSHNPTFAFTETNKDQWFKRFKSIMGDHWDFNEVISTRESLEAAITKFMLLVTRASTITCTRKLRSPRSAKWWNKETQTALKTMRKDRECARKIPTPHNLLRSKMSAAHFKYQTKRAKRSHALKIAASTPTDKIWSLNSWYRGVRKTITPALRNPDGTISSSSEDKSRSLIRNWFPPVKPIPGSFVVDLTEPLPHTRPFSPVTKEELHEAFKHTSNTSAPRISQLNYKVLKWAETLFPEVFHQLVNLSVQLGSHHSSWKRALIVTLSKPNKPRYDVAKSYRPIQLLECLGKLVEKIVASRMLFDAGKFNLLPTTQFGGRPHSSCLDAGLSLVHDIETARKRGLSSSLLTVDIKGFFDHVQHKRLIWVLWNMGFPTEICQWVSSFVSDRSASVCIDGVRSLFFPIDVGVPQGSPVSPVLACLYAVSHTEVAIVDICIERVE